MSQVIVITGGSADVGRATAREVARHGDRIAVFAHSPALIPPSAHPSRQSWPLSSSLADQNAQVLDSDGS
jgi:NAD(P)-dependent dehydrogenase (short-subunit alcohol dehydrogenase family)